MKLTYKKRNKLPKRDFAIPEERRYPIEDEAHARNALARVSTFGTKTEQRRVRKAVRRRYPHIGIPR
jgi:predicted DNA-binding helix-hairpin-helix protein